MRVCKTCFIEKSLENFRLRSADRKHSLHCNLCENQKQVEYRSRPEVKDKIRDQKREYNKGRRWHRKTTHLIRTYGITEEQYKEMLSTQESRCLICSDLFSSENKPCVDHCHTTGKVRGLLCQPCNKGLGFFRDSPDRLLSAIRYLNKE